MNPPSHRQDLDFCFDIHELGRRAGAMMTAEREIAAPSDWGTPVLGLKPGSVIDLEAQFESVVEGVWVSGSATVELVGSCSRCLDPIAEQLAVELHEMFKYADLADNENDDDDLPLVLDDYVDLEVTIRDAVVLALPLAPVCDTSCLGLCSICGVSLSENPNHAHEQVDPRWEILSQLKKEDY